METITETELLDVDIETLLQARALPSMSASYPSPLACDHRLDTDHDTILSTEDKENPFRGKIKVLCNGKWEYPA